MPLTLVICSYLNGHEHCLEYIAPSNTSMVFITSGTGMEVTGTEDNADAIPEGSLKFIVSSSNATVGFEGGFVSMQVTSPAMNAIYHNQDGVALYTSPDILPRSSAYKNR